MSVNLLLSAVTDEFSDYRSQLRRDLTRHNVEVKVQEDFKDAGVAMLDQLDLYIRSCDAVVHLVGDMTGSNPASAAVAAMIRRYPDIVGKLPPLGSRGLQISYTQWEAWLALYHGKLLLIANAEGTAPRGPNYQPSEASRAAQRAHLERLRAIERYPGITFNSSDNLARKIAYTAILDLLASKHHRQSRREALDSACAVLHLLDGKKKLAEIFADRALMIDPGQPHALYVRGLLELQGPVTELRNFSADRAEACFDTASQAGLEPQCAWPRIILRHDHYCFRKRKEPAPELRDLLKLYHSNRNAADSWPYGVLNGRIVTSAKFKAFQKV